MSKVIIFGVGDLAQVADVYLTHDSPHEVVAFTVDENYLPKGPIHGKEVVPFEQLQEKYPPDAYSMFVAIGYSKLNRARHETFDRCKGKGYKLISYVSSQAMRSPETQIGENCFIFENNVIQPFVSIGDDCILWSGNHVGHHSTIGPHCFIASHCVISGRCTIGDHSFLGVNATIIDGITVGPDTLVGAGALITKNTVEKGLYKGIQAELAKLNTDRLRENFQ